MTNIQAINLLKGLWQSLDDYCELNDEGKAAFCMAIEALSCSEIPNSSDTISRQATIDALDEQIGQCDKALSAFDISMKDAYTAKVERASLAAFRETLEILPSVQPEPHWIPVSERVPEKSGYYITSNEYGGVNEDFYHDGHFWNADKNAYEVTAWMPKPSPYQKGATP